MNSLNKLTFIFTPFLAQVCQSYKHLR
jgi:hypothetical protein